MITATLFAIGLLSNIFGIGSGVSGIINLKHPNLIKKAFNQAIDDVLLREIRDKKERKQKKADISKMALAEIDEDELRIEMEKWKIPPEALDDIVKKITICFKKHLKQAGLIRTNPFKKSFQLAISDTIINFST